MQRCRWFQRRHVTAVCARKSSPCSACCRPEGDKIRPAREKWLKIGVLWRAGRVLYRVSGEEGVLGEFCRVYRHGSQVSQVRWHPTCRKWWGFALHEALWLRVAGVSELHVVQFPRLVVVRPPHGLVSCPQCRPPRRKTPTMGCCRLGGIRFGRCGVWDGVCAC